MMNNKMKILLVCKSLPWSFKGGVQTHTWELSQSLSTFGHEVNILTAGSIRRGYKTYTKNDIQIHEIPYLPGRYIKTISSIAEEFSFNLSARSWIKKNENDYDIIHLQGTSGYLYASNKKTVICTVHGLCENETQRNSSTLENTLYSNVTRFFEKKSINKSCRIITVSKGLKEELVQKEYTGIKKIEVINNGINKIINSGETNQSKKSKLLFVGGLHPDNGLDVLIKTMSKVHDEIGLDIIGEGPYENEVKKLIENYNLGHRVNMLEEMTKGEVYSHMQNSMALILPSLYETQGMVLLEAYANGIPVIASRLESIKEKVKDGINGLLCEPNNPEHFASAIHYLYDYPTESEMMGLYGRDMVHAKYSWDLIAKDTISIYEQALVA
jgi:glycosyltransferase involved in cell wall biosynthesis